MKKTYKFDELSEQAQQRARDCLLGDGWGFEFDENGEIN